VLAASLIDHPKKISSVPFTSIEGFRSRGKGRLNLPLFRRCLPNWDDTTPDEVLVGWTQRGHGEAFGILYDRYLTKVYSYCYRLLGEREAAQDANSIVFTKALAGLPIYHQGTAVGCFRGWLFAIAHNVITDELRARRGTESLDAVEWMLDPSPSPEEQAIAASERHAVQALLPRLSADQRHVVALRLSGLTAAEIGEVLGRPRNAIDGIHHRALLRLQELVAIGSAPATTQGGRGHD
jgi:RNA polymerase sigma-70 factor (ECF subfamily)